jgi:hypothetical protein
VKTAGSLDTLPFIPVDELDCTQMNETAGSSEMFMNMYQTVALHPIVSKMTVYTHFV